MQGMLLWARNMLLLAGLASPTLYEGQYWSLSNPETPIEGFATMLVNLPLLSFEPQNDLI